MRLVIRLCLLLPYNAAIFSTNVRFPLCSLVCLFGKVVLFFWQYDERFISPEYILQVCAIFDTTCFAHLVILPACHIYRSCVIFSHILLLFLSFLFFMRILFELCLFSPYIFPQMSTIRCIMYNPDNGAACMTGSPRGHPGKNQCCFCFLLGSLFLILEPFAVLRFFSKGLICARDSGFLNSQYPFYFPWQYWLINLFDICVLCIAVLNSLSPSLFTITVTITITFGSLSGLFRALMLDSCLITPLFWHA